MFMRKMLELTESQIEYDRMLRESSQLQWDDLKLHKYKMRILETKIQELRWEVEHIIQSKHSK